MHIKHYLPWFVYALFMVLMGGYVLKEQATNERLVINTLIDKTLCKSDDLLDNSLIELNHSIDSRCLSYKCGQNDTCQSRSQAIIQSAALVDSFIQAKVSNPKISFVLANDTMSISTSNVANIIHRFRDYLLAFVAQDSVALGQINGLLSPETGRFSSLGSGTDWRSEQLYLSVLRSKIKQAALIALLHQRASIYSGLPPTEFIPAIFTQQSVVQTGKTFNADIFLVCYNIIQTAEYQVNGTVVPAERGVAHYSKTFAQLGFKHFDLSVMVTFPFTGYSKDFKNINKIKIFK